MLFELKNVNFKNIVRYPDIKIRNSGTVFICGESGSGKSTLLKLLNGSSSANDGEILYNGKPLGEYEPVGLRREVLLCGQNAYLFDGSIKENFTEFYKYRDLQPVSEEEISKFLKICAADFPVDSPCLNMSGGEKQRVFMALCLSFKPKVLLLDEPTSALDDATANTVLTNMKLFCKHNNIALIIVSHSKALTASFADSVITLEAGNRNG